MEFKTLIVYQKAKEVYQLISKEVIPNMADLTMRDQLRRASLSIVLNLAEGTCRISDIDKRRFFVISRCSAYESYACIDLLDNFESNCKTTIQYLLEEISEILFALIKKLSGTEKTKEQ